jgi:hypothetical protein
MEGVTVSCSQPHFGLIVALLVIGGLAQLVGVVWTAITVGSTRRALENRTFLPITINYSGPQPGQSPDTQKILDALNSAVDDLDVRLRDLVTEAFKVRAWPVFLIAGGLVLTLVGSLWWLASPVTCSS